MMKSFLSERYVNKTLTTGRREERKKEREERERNGGIFFLHKTFPNNILGILG